jgi:predicted nuclease of predicted toxin-antitoxin system
VRLLLDEMIPAAVARQLRGRGLDAVSVSERSDLRSLSDPDLGERAQTESRAIVTYDCAGFLALAMRYQNASRTHQGVVLLNQRRFPQRSSPVGGTLAESIEALAHRTSATVSFVEWLQ